MVAQDRPQVQLLDEVAHEERQMAFWRPVPEAGAANNKSCSGRYDWYVFAPIYDRGIKHDYSHGLLNDDGEVDAGASRG